MSNVTRWQTCNFTNAMLSFFVLTEIFPFRSFIFSATRIKRKDSWKKRWRKWTVPNMIVWWAGSIWLRAETRDPPSSYSSPHPPKAIPMGMSAGAEFCRHDMLLARWKLSLRWVGIRSRKLYWLKMSARRSILARLNFNRCILLKFSHFILRETISFDKRDENLSLNVEINLILSEICNRKGSRKKDSIRPIMSNYFRN